MLTAALLPAFALVSAGCATAEFEAEPLRQDAYQQTRRLIITADDFGAHPAIDRGVTAGVEAGLVTSVSAMVTFDRAPEAIAALREKHPEIGIGLHLSLTSGGPVSPPASVPTLVRPDAGGRFYNVASFIARLPEVKLAEVEREFRAQIEALQKLGISVDHLASQHNIAQVYGPFFDIVLDLAAEYDIPVRSPVPASLADPQFAPSMTQRRAMSLAASAVTADPFSVLRFGDFTTLEEMQRNRLRLDERDIRHPDLLIDAFWGQPTAAKLYEILSGLPEGSAELVVHLGTYNRDVDLPPGISEDYMQMRDFELVSLTSPRVRQWIDLLGIRLIGYQDLRR
jgi:predicted glycoside hydrolase/deacetylase ChbG (UPF0249 family)